MVAKYTFEKVDVTEEKGCEKWNTLCEEFSFIPFAFHSDIAQFLSDYMGMIPKYHVIKSQDNIIGLYPSLVHNGKLISLPHFSYGGPLFKFRNDEIEDLTSGYSSYLVRSLQPLSSLSYSPKIISFITLKDYVDSQDIWLSFKSKLRSQVRKTLCNNIEFSFGRLDVLDDFYHVYSQNMHSLGSPALSKYFFELLLNKCRGALIFVCYYQKAPVAVAFSLTYFRFTEVCWASALKEYNYLGVNMFMYWHMIEYSKDILQSDYFSFGRSSPGSGSFKFKKQWGVDNIELWYTNNGGRLGQDGLAKMIFRKIWVSMPSTITKSIGPIIAKKFY